MKRSVITIGMAVFLSGTVVAVAGSTGTSTGTASGTSFVTSTGTSSDTSVVTSTGTSSSTSIVTATGTGTSTSTTTDPSLCTVIFLPTNDSTVRVAIKILAPSSRLFTYAKLYRDGWQTQFDNTQGGAFLNASDSEPRELAKKYIYYGVLKEPNGQQSTCSAILKKPPPPPTVQPPQPPGSTNCSITFNPVSGTQGHWVEVNVTVNSPINTWEFASVKWFMDSNSGPQPQEYKTKDSIYPIKTIFSFKTIRQAGNVRYTGTLSGYDYCYADLFSPPSTYQPSDCSLSAYTLPDNSSLNVELSLGNGPYTQAAELRGSDGSAYRYTPGVVFPATPWSINTFGDFRRPWLVAYEGYVNGENSPSCKLNVAACTLTATVSPNLPKKVDLKITQFYKPTEPGAHWISVKKMAGQIGQSYSTTASAPLSFTDGTPQSGQIKYTAEIDGKPACTATVTVQ